jgi:hypothetical protein
MRVRAVLGVAAVAAALGLSGGGVAHAEVECEVSQGGALWCEDTETGQTWQEEPYGTYDYCSSPGANEDLCPYRPDHSQNGWS